MTDATPNKNEISELFEATAFDNTGDKLGSVNEVFLDDRTGQPTFVEVNHGLFGLSSSLVPLRGSSLNAGSLNLGFSKDAIKDAPNIDTDNGLSVDEENRIYAHYGLTDARNADYFRTETSHAEAPGTTGRTDVTATPGTAGTADTDARGNNAHRDSDLAGDAQEKVREYASGDAHKEADFGIVSETPPGNPANSGVGGGAPSGAARSDTDTTVASEPAVADDNEGYPADSQGKPAREHVREGKAPGDFDADDKPSERFKLRRYSDRQTGTVKW